MSGNRDTVRLSGILGRKRLEFADNAELERYYEEKYRHGGYAGEGCSIRGIDISGAYHRARQESALRLLDPQPGDTVLDAGCGDGSLSRALATRAHVVCAVDIAGNAIDPSVSLATNIQFQKMNIESLGFPDAYFDRIVCVETLEHLLNPTAALAEFQRTLVRRGTLVVTYPTVNRTRIKTWQRRIGLGGRIDISEHLTEWSFDELTERVRAAGFSLVASEGVVFDFGMFGRLRYSSAAATRALTRLSLAIRSFPRNSAFVSARFQKAG